jgi:hypothetical protein
MVYIQVSLRPEVSPTSHIITLETISISYAFIRTRYRAHGRYTAEEWQTHTACGSPYSTWHIDPGSTLVDKVRRSQEDGDIRSVVVL